MYTSEAVFREETRRLFRFSWLCIGLVSDVPNPGDVFPVRFAGVPMFVVRDKASNIRVFHNVCAHRGALLVSEARRCRGNIVCPYHSWAFGLDGRLLRTPNVGGAGNHDWSDGTQTLRGLVEVRSASWNGLLFVDISANSAPFHEFIAPLESRIGPLDQKIIRFDRDLSTEMTFEANWKLVIENFVESYHVPSIHPELEKLNPMRDHYQILGGHSYLGQGGVGYSATDAGEMAGLPLRNGADASKYEVFYLYPNLIFGPLPNFGFVIIVNPKSAEITHERIEFLFYGDEAMTSGNEPLRRSNASFLQYVNAQDIEICKSVQAGRHSPAFAGGVFALSQEKTSLHFLQMVAAHMLVEEGSSANEVIDLPTEDIFHRVP